MSAIVESSETVLLVGGGLATEKTTLRCSKLSSKVIAADGGAAHCLEFGLKPDAIIGDFDSFDVPDGTFSFVRHVIEEQDSTDFDKSLRSIKAPLVLGAGFTGGRMDHYLACLNTLVRHSNRRCVLVDESDVTFLLPPRVDFPLPEGTRVSLFPMGRVDGVSAGLKWPIAGLKFAPDGPIGTSNEATGDVHLSIDAPKLLAILPAEFLELVVETLLSSDATWPVRDR